MKGNDRFRIKIRERSKRNEEFEDFECTGVDVDNIWHFLGRFGVYQMTQISVTFLASLAFAFPVLSGIFTGKTSVSKCVLDNTTGLNDLNTTIKASSCYIQEIDNNTNDVLNEEMCSKYEYEGGNVLLSYIAEWDLVCDREILGQLPQILTMVGMLIGAFLLPPLGDRFGRKKLVIGSILSLFVTSLLLAFVENFELFLFFKLLNGAFQQGSLVPIFTLMIEVMPSELSSLVSVFATIAWIMSECFTGIFGFVFRQHSWRTLQLVTALWILPLLVCICFTDESLRWLVGNCKEKEVSAILHKACRMNKKDYNQLTLTVLNRNTERDEVCPLKAEDRQVGAMAKSHQSDDSIQYKTLIINKNMRKITVFSCYTWMVSSLTYYSLILMSTSLVGDPYVNYFLGVIVELPAAFLILYTMQSFGRRITIIYSQTISATALLLSVFVVRFAPSSMAYTILQTCLTLTGKFFVTCTFSTVWLYTPELYPTNFRVLGLGVSSTCARLGASFSPLFTILSRKAVWAPGMMCSVGCYISAILLTMLPETRWRKLPSAVEEVDQWFQKGPKVKNSNLVEKQFEANC